MIDWVRRRCGYRFPPLGGTASRLVTDALPARVQTELFPGIRAELDLSDGTQRSTYWQGERAEYPTAPVLHEWARAGATAFFDIGANYGFFSFMMASRHPSLDVYAFEPHPGTYRRLDGIRADNALANVRTYNIGLGDEPALLTLHPGVSDAGHSTFLSHPELHGAIDQVVVRPFDEWRRSQGLALPSQPSWVAKIDVEGFEVSVIDGMRDALHAQAFIGLVVEVLPFTLALGGRRPADVTDALAAAGYVPAAPERAPKRVKTDNIFFVPADRRAA
jgi:FkbM family methyltransferase